MNRKKWRHGKRADRWNGREGGRGKITRMREDAASRVIGGVLTTASLKGKSRPAKVLLRFCSSFAARKLAADRWASCVAEAIEK